MIWQELERPFLVLAPMDDVTDTVFRRIVAECGPPDVFFTEFASADGLQSAGRQAVEQKLAFTEKEQPLIAQIWGTKPENFEKSAREIAKKGFVGIDLNMGCPVRNVVKLGACSALINNRELAGEIIQATKKGAGDLPVSVKTRLGDREYDESWIRFLLEQNIAVLTVHMRTVKEMSKVGAHWELTKGLVKLRDEISPDTLIVGNGDAMNRSQAEEWAKRDKLDGVMIGRAVFQDPCVFSRESPWPDMTRDEKLALYREHIELFAETWGTKKNPHSLKKFAKVYASGFSGANQLREELMTAETALDLVAKLG